MLPQSTVRLFIAARFCQWCNVSHWFSDRVVLSNFFIHVYFLSKVSHVVKVVVKSCKSFVPGQVMNVCASLVLRLVKTSFKYPTTLPNLKFMRNVQIDTHSAWKPLSFTQSWTIRSPENHLLSEVLWLPNTNDPNFDSPRVLFTRSSQG